jgi:acyl-CoA synthetase (AMP-forming)/AMP-acid ligase II
MEPVATKKRTLRQERAYKKVNPYLTDRTGQSVVVLNLTEYYLSLLMSMSPVAIRTFLVLASRVQPDGSATATLVEIRRYNAHNVANISLGLKELLKANLIRRKSISSYWLSDKVVYNLNLLPGNA